MANQIEYFSVRDLFDKKLYNCKRCLTLQNLPKTFNPDDIINYLEVVTRKGLTGICYASGIGKGNVMVAVLDDEIADLSSIKERPLCGKKIIFHYLGDVAGIVILDVGTVAELKLQLYFESPKRSGGKEDTVKCVEFHSLECGNVAVVTIQDIEAIDGILSRTRHVISSHTLVVEPYFPSFHNYLMNFFRQPRMKGEGDIRLNCATNKIQPSPRSLFPNLQTEDKRSEQTGLGYTVNLSYQKETPLLINFENKSVLRPSEESIPQRNNHPQNIEDEYSGSRKPLIKDISEKFTELTSRQNDAKESQGKNKIKIICDDEDDNQIIYHRVSQSKDISTCSMPVVEEPMSKTEISKDEIELGQVNPRILSSLESQSDRRTYQREKQFSEKIQNISRAKIVLLKIGHFQDKCKKKELNVDVGLVEKTCTVTLKSNSETDILQAKLILHELLQSVVKQSVKIFSKDRANYLARQNIQDCLRFKAKNEKIGTVFEMIIDSMELVCYGFRDENVKRGIDLLSEMFSKEIINLRKGQIQFLQSPGWCEICRNRGTDSIAIYETDGNIVIESLKTVKREKIQGIRTAIIEFLKSASPKHKAVIEMSGGKAEYFEKYCKMDLENQMRNKEVSLQIKKVKHDRPIKVEIILEGDLKFIEDVKMKVQVIWHEPVDFKRISTDGGDIWQIMRSLDGDIGKDFFRGFQKDNKCIIEVIKNGEIQPPAMKIVEHMPKQPEKAMMPKVQSRFQKRQSDSDYSPDTEDELETFSSNVAQENENTLQATGLQEYQEGLVGETALALALEQSFEESGSFNDMQLQDRYEKAMTHETHSKFPVRNVELDYSQDTENDTNSLHAYASVMLENRRALQARHVQEYQHGMSEEVAIAWALEQSMEESGSFDNLNTDNEYKRRFQNDFIPSPVNKHVDDQRIVPRPISRKNSAHCFENSPLVYERCNKLDLGNTQLVLMKGMIADQKADVLVNIVDPTGDFPGQSTVAKAFAKRGGPALINQYSRLKKYGPASTVAGYVTVSDVVGNLNCKAVFHVQLDKTCQVSEIIPKVMREIYQKCTRMGYVSISFPPLGVGHLYNYPASELAKIMITETNRMSLSPLQDVSFVIYHEDIKTYKIFDAAFNQHRRPIQSHLKSRPSSHPTRQYPTGNEFSPITQIRSKTLAQKEDYHRNAFQRLLPLQRHYLERDREPHLRMVFKTNDQSNRHQERPHRSGERDKQSVTNNVRSERCHLEDKTRRREEGQRRRMSRSTERSYIQGDEKLESKQYRKSRRESRFSKEVPASKLYITVFAGGKDDCERLRNNLAKKIRNCFLFEKEIKKVKRVSEGTKGKIIKILEQQKVKSVKRDGSYVLKGYKENVMRANEDILNSLLEDKPAEVMTDKRQKKSRVKRATAEHARYMAVEDAEVPNYWKNYKSGKIVKNLIVDLKHLLTNKKFEKEVLDENGHTFKTILRLINRTFKTDHDKIGQGKDARGLQQYSQFFVLKICRIENLELYEAYVEKRSNLFRKLFQKKSGYFKKLDAVEGVGRCEPCETSCLNRDQDLASDIYEEVNECFSFHGTKLENVDKICSEGPDNRLCSPDAMFGQGIYGAESVVKADQYADDQNSRTMGKGNPKKMFLMRMLLGDIFVCKDANPHKYKRAPCTSCYKDNCRHPDHGYKFDSVVGNIEKKLFREFVVYESRQCYPEYLITYERR